MLHCRPFIAFCESVAVNAACETHPAFNEERKQVKWAGCGKTMQNIAFENEKIRVLTAMSDLPDKVKTKDSGNYSGQSKLHRT